MRKVKKRFRKSLTRSAPTATRTLEGVTRYRNSDAGRYAKWERLMSQRESQANNCAVCGQYMHVQSTRFQSNKFVEGQDNLAVHKQCPSRDPDPHAPESGI